MKHKFLKKKITIGSIHGKLNYNKIEKVFHSDDVPLKVKERVKDVNLSKKNIQYIDKNVLKTGYLPEWCNSTNILSNTKNTIPNGKLNLHKKKLIKSLTATKNLHKQPNTELGTCDFRDLYSYLTFCQKNNIKTPWNCSIKTEILFNKIKNCEYTYNKKSKNIKINEYISPINRTNNIIHDIRMAKNEYRKEIIEELKQKDITKRLQKSKYILSQFSDEKKIINKENTQNIKEKLDKTYNNNDTINEYFNRDKKFDENINKKLIQIMMKKRNDAYNTRDLLKMQEKRKFDIIRTYYHNGSWENNKINDNEYCWSCCMNSNINSQGCQLKSFNTAQWQVCGY